VIVNFYVEFQARHAVEEIRKQVATTAAVLRDGRELELPIAELVPGDIVRLNAGDLAPADARLLDTKDLHVRESALTGSPCPWTRVRVIFQTGNTASPTPVTAFSWILPFRPEWAQRASIRTGKNTAFGEIAHDRWEA
jgi:Mg2+-importing ATPase